MIERISRVDLRFLAACLLVAVVLVNVVLAFWQLLILLGLGALGVGMVWWSRQAPAADMDPAYTPVGLPAVPEPPEPSGQWLSLLPEGLTRPFASELCPYCHERFSPLPTLRARCSSCRELVHVRMGPDGSRYLLQEIDLPTMAAEWEAAVGPAVVEPEQLARAHREALLVQAWQLTFAGMPKARCVDLTGGELRSVVGEGNYQQALASASSLAGGNVRRRDVVAVLVPERENRLDPNAVRVEVFGRLVGYVRQPAASEMSQVLLKLRRQGLHVASEAQIVGARCAAGDGLKLGIRLRLIHHARWAEILDGRPDIRTPDVDSASKPQPKVGWRAIDGAQNPRSPLRRWPSLLRQ